MKEEADLGAGINGPGAACSSGGRGFQYDEEVKMPGASSRARRPCESTPPV
jgi:hypothetical protein